MAAATLPGRGTVQTICISGAFRVSTLPVAMLQVATLEVRRLSLFLELIVFETLFLVLARAMGLLWGSSRTPAIGPSIASAVNRV